MLNIQQLAIEEFVRELKNAYTQTYNMINPEFGGILEWVGRLALENIANSDALYHNFEHTIMVTMVGQAILKGKHLREGGVTPKDWVEFLMALLCHDIGYVRGVCRADRPGEYATGVHGETVQLSIDGTDAALTPYHVDRSKLFLEERFGNNEIPLSMIEGADVIDVGCGSGRYSCALGLLGAKSVTGVDYSDSGLALAHELAERYKLSNVSFKKASILELPFDGESFDFVFCHGVTMTTGNMDKATEELYRVMKTGGHGWYYVYGAGGAFWYIRRKLNEFIKQFEIPQDYALSVLDMIGMPGNRHIFADNWYVPIEGHTSKTEFEDMMTRAGFASFRRCYKGRSTDPDLLVVTGTDEDRQMWGDGELRYLISK